MILKGEELSKRFTKMSCESKPKEVRVKKVIKRNGGKLYVKRNVFVNFFNSWIDKKYIVT